MGTARSPNWIACAYFSLFLRIHLKAEPLAGAAGRRQTVGMIRIVGLVTAVVALAGCGRPAWHSDAPGVVPADFALVFTVEGEGAVGGARRTGGAEGEEADPLRAPSHYVLESDRTFRVALGPGAGEMTYPPPTATLSPSQVEDLYGLIRRHGLAAESSARATGPVTYRIAITADGRRRRYTTTPDASPGAQALLKHLVELRGGLPPQRHGL